MGLSRPFHHLVQRDQQRQKADQLFAAHFGVVHYTGIPDHRPKYQHSDGSLPGQRGGNRQLSGLDRLIDGCFEHRVRRYIKTQPTAIRLQGFHILNRKSVSLHRGSPD